MKEQQTTPQLLAGEISVGSSSASMDYLHMRYYFLCLSLTSPLKQKLGQATLSLECRTENHGQESPLVIISTT